MTLAVHIDEDEYRNAMLDLMISGTEGNYTFNSPAIMHNPFCEMNFLSVFCLKRKSDRSFTNCTQAISKWKNSFFESIDKCFHTGTPAKDHPCSYDHSTTSNIAESTVRCDNL